MKKTLIAMTVACVSALTVLAEGDASAATAKYEDLKFGTNSWFSVTKDETVGGSVTSTEQFGTAGEYITFESMDNPVTFTATDDCAQKVATVTLAVKASTVPNGMLKTAESDGKIAVSLYESTANSATNFVAYLGSGKVWITLTGGSVPSEGEDYMLLIRFDNRNGGKKVSFVAVVKGVETVLKGTGDVVWFDYGTALSQKVNVGFLGKGAMTRFDGIQLNIIAEVVPAGDDGSVVIKEEDAPALEAAAQEKGFADVGAYMAASANGNTPATRAPEGVTVAQAYALGLIKTDGTQVVAVNDGALEVKAEGATVTSEGIKVNFIDITPDPSKVQSIVYKLYGSVDGQTYDTTPIEMFESEADIKIPASELTGANPKHFFKVAAEVTLIPAK